MLPSHGSMPDPPNIHIFPSGRKYHSRLTFHPPPPSTFYSWSECMVWVQGVTSLPYTRLATVPQQLTDPSETVSDDLVSDSRAGERSDLVWSILDSTSTWSPPVHPLVPLRDFVRSSAFTLTHMLSMTDPTSGVISGPYPPHRSWGSD